MIVSSLVFRLVCLLVCFLLVGVFFFWFGFGAAEWVWVCFNDFGLIWVFVSVCLCFVGVLTFAMEWLVFGIGVLIMV